MIVFIEKLEKSSREARAYWSGIDENGDQYGGAVELPLLGSVASRQDVLDAVLAAFDFKHEVVLLVSNKPLVGHEEAYQAALAQKAIRERG